MSDEYSFSSPKFDFEESQNQQEQRDYVDRKIAEHQHNGAEAQLVEIDNIDGLFDTVTAVPSTAPNNMYDQIKVYRSGSTYRLYIYDTNSNTWRYASLT